MILNHCLWDTNQKKDAHWGERPGDGRAPPASSSIYQEPQKRVSVPGLSGGVWPRQPVAGRHRAALPLGAALFHFSSSQMKVHNFPLFPHELHLCSCERELFETPWE